MIKRVLALCALLVAACANDTSGITSSDIQTATAQTTGTFQEYPLPQSNSGLMRPAIDHEGRIWFGEMGHNYLGVFDPRSHTFEQSTPPHGRDGVMGVQVAADDSIWFAEQYANYIGHYLPATGQYRVYNLPTLMLPDPGNAIHTLSLPCAPNDIALDAQGNIWFSELNADSLGRLDPRTGRITQFPLTRQQSIQKLDPYGIAIDQQGMVWFTEATNDHVGRLDPRSGQIRYFNMPGPAVQFMELASDPHGIIWITSFNNNLLVSLDPRRGTFTPYYAPSSAPNGTGALYGLAISPGGEIWVTLNAGNQLARLDVASHHFTDYPIPTPGSLPFGVVLGPAHTLWFTEAGSDKIGVLQA